MATVFNKTTFEYRTSVHSPNYDAADWIINPDVSALKSGNVPIRYWKAVDLGGDNWDVQEMDQAEKDAVDHASSDVGNEVIAGNFSFQGPGYCHNKWLGPGIIRNGKNAPYLVPQPIKISAISYTNLRPNINHQIEIYRNGVLEHTWNITDSRWALVSSGLYDLCFDAGDQITLYARRVGTESNKKKWPRDVVVVLHYTVINRDIQDISGN